MVEMQRPISDFLSGVKDKSPGVSFTLQRDTMMVLIKIFREAIKSSFEIFQLQVTPAEIKIGLFDRYEHLMTIISLDHKKSIPKEIMRYSNLQHIVKGLRNYPLAKNKSSIPAEFCITETNSYLDLRYEDFDGISYSIAVPILKDFEIWEQNSNHAASIEFEKMLKIQAHDWQSLREHLGKYEHSETVEIKKTHDSKNTLDWRPETNANINVPVYNTIDHNIDFKVLTRQITPFFAITDLLTFEYVELGLEFPKPIYFRIKDPIIHQIVYLSSYLRKEEEC